MTLLHLLGRRRLPNTARTLLLLLTIGGGAATTWAQQPHTEFRGKPLVKVTVSGATATAEKVPVASAPNLMCVVSKIGDDYYWASRENVPLVKVDAGGAYVTYVAANGAGYVKVLKAERKALAGAADTTAKEYDYVEHLMLGLNSITYYGLIQ